MGLVIHAKVAFRVVVRANRAPPMTKNRNTGVGMIALATRSRGWLAVSETGSTPPATMAIRA